MLKALKQFTQFTGQSTSQCFKINIIPLWVVEQCQWSVPVFLHCLILWLSLAILLNALLNLHLPVFSLSQNNVNTITFKMQCHYEYLFKHTKIAWVQRAVNKESSQSLVLLSKPSYFSAQVCTYMESFDGIVQKNTGITVIISADFVTVYTPLHHLRKLRKEKRIVGLVIPVQHTKCYSSLSEVLPDSFSIE